MMGGKRDMNARNAQKHVNDDAHEYCIETARNHIHGRKYAVNSAAVDRILVGKSLVPTSVSNVPTQIIALVLNLAFKNALSK
jgi:hypothetical protein